MLELRCLKRGCGDVPTARGAFSYAERAAEPSLYTSRVFVWRYTGWENIRTSQLLRMYMVELGILGIHKESYFCSRALEIRF